MKKWLSLILAVVLTASICACGGKDKEKESAGKDDITLTWLLPGDKQADLASVLEEVNKITLEKIGAKVDMQFIDTGAYSEKLTMNMASGGKFDLCFTGYVNKYDQAVSKGGLMEIGSLIDEHAHALKEAVPDYLWEGAKINGKIYAVPNEQIMAQPIAVTVPKSIAEKYDFDFSKVEKISDIEPFLEMVKNGEPGKYPFRVNFSIQMWYNDVYEEISDAGIAVRTDGSSLKTVDLFETPEYKEGLNTMREWYKKGYIRPDVASVGDDTTDYKAGKYVVSTMTTKPGDEQELLRQFGQEYIIVPVTKPYLKTNNIVATMIGVSRNCKHPVEAVNLIELLNTDKELYNLVSYGIKGKHYNLNENNKVEFIENSGYMPNAAWKFGNQFNAYIMAGNDDDIWEKTKEMNETSLKSPLLGFSLDQSPIKNEISQISSVNSKYSARFDGSADPSEYWDKYVEELNAAGRQKVMEEIQRQLDEWSKSNK